MKKLITIFAFLCFTGSVTFGCSCFGETNFCSTLTGEFTTPPDIVVKAVKVEDIYYGMRVEVVDILQGSTDRDTLMVWGDNGALCRVYTSSFSLGDTLILSLHYTDFSGNFITVGFPPDLEKEGDFHLSVCGIYYLTVENGIVNGPIDPDNSQMTYETFSDLACLVTGIPPVPEINVELFPNPAFNEITLYFWNSQPYPLNFKVYDTLGRLMIREESQLVAGQKTIDVSGLGNGVYVLFIENEGRLENRKFVVSR